MPTTKVPASRMVDHNIGSYCFRNKLINGEFKIWQRSTSQNTTGYGSADRWKIDVWNGMNVFVQQTNNIGGCAFYASSSTNRAVIAQTLENSQIACLLGRTATFSFLANTSGVNQTLTAYIQKSVTANNSAATNWVNIESATFTIPANTTNQYSISGFIPNDNTVSGLRVVFESVNIPNGSGIGLFLAQLEVGPTVTPFEYRPIGTELALCQRYYEVVDILPTGVTYGPNGDTRGTSVNYKVTKRTTPTLNPTSTPITILSVGQTGTGINLNGSVPYNTTSQTLFVNGTMGNITNITNATGGSNVFAWADNAIRTVTANAEL